MVSKQAQKSIKQFRRFAKILSALYRSPNEMTNWRIKLFRWLVDLQGIFGCRLYTSPSPRDSLSSRMPSSA